MAEENQDQTADFSAATQLLDQDLSHSLAQKTNMSSKPTVSMAMKRPVIG